QLLDAGKQGDHKTTEKQHRSRIAFNQHREKADRMMRNITYPVFVEIIPFIFIPIIFHEGIVQPTTICSHIKCVLYKAVFTECIVHTSRKYINSPAVVLKIILLY